MLREEIDFPDELLGENLDEDWTEAALRAAFPDVNPADPQLKDEGEEQRKNERFNFPAINVMVRLGHERFPLVNISTGGISFLSDKPIAKGNSIKVSPLTFRHMPVLVFRCDIHPGPLASQYPYLVRARFPRNIDDTLLGRVVDNLLQISTLGLAAPH